MSGSQRPGGTCRISIGVGVVPGPQGRPLAEVFPAWIRALISRAQRRQERTRVCSRWVTEPDGERQPGPGPAIRMSQSWTHTFYLLGDRSIPRTSIQCIRPAPRDTVREPGPQETPCRMASCRLLRVSENCRALWQPHMLPPLQMSSPAEAASPTPPVLVNWTPSKPCTALPTSCRGKEGRVDGLSQVERVCCNQLVTKSPRDATISGAEHGSWPLTG
uniref:Uncharacterized protein n=1 Tax=Rousettus aegyptiacus TaxID=9407 RepID=A0A7J8JHM2_ROUAE|nr:hypothetical protein HJG63_010423 [Rousettus aegyptiacus]